MIDRCFDGGAAARLEDVTLEYTMLPAAASISMRVHYQTAGSAEGERRLIVGSTSSGPMVSTTQDLAFAIPRLGSRSLRVHWNDRVSADLVIADGEVTGQSMIVGGEIVAVESSLDDAVLLPGAARALLPFLRVDQCDRVTLPSFYPPDTHHSLIIEIGQTVVADVPAGQFEAVEVFIDGRHGREVYLVRSEAPHFVLKSISADGMVTAELTAIAPAGS
jgi:hypothetical protein